MALLIDGLGVTPAYCSGTGGCHAVKLAAKRVFGPVPVPLLGLLALSGLLGITTLKGDRFARRLELLGALFAAILGVTLLLVQAVLLRTFCPFCVVVDICAVLASTALFAAHHWADPNPGADCLRRFAVVGLGVVACGTPFAWAELRPASGLPAALAKFASPCVKG